jgi:predicted metallo-beta-lactamase superfamily hydrolase
MSDKQLQLVSILFSSALVLEIFKLIVAGIKSHRQKKLKIKSMPEQLNAIDEKVNTLSASTVEGFNKINKKLDADAEHFKKVDDTLLKMAQAINHNAEGTALGLKNDLIIFNAFRDHHINGESEIAEREVKDYLLAETQHQLTV